MVRWRWLWSPPSPCSRTYINLCVRVSLPRVHFVLCIMHCCPPSLPNCSVLIFGEIEGWVDEARGAREARTNQVFRRGACKVSTARCHRPTVHNTHREGGTASVSIHLEEENAVTKSSEARSLSLPASILLVTLEPCPFFWNTSGINKSPQCTHTHTRPIVSISLVAATLPEITGFCFCIIIRHQERQKKKAAAALLRDGH